MSKLIFPYMLKWKKMGYKEENVRRNPGEKEPKQNPNTTIPPSTLPQIPPDRESPPLFTRFG